MIRLAQHLNGAAGDIDLFFTDAVAPSAGGDGVAVRAAKQASPYGGFNLGAHVGDDAASVEANRRALAARVGVPRGALRFMNQVHGNQVQLAAGTTPEPPSGSSAPDGADGIVTTEACLGLVVLVADCTPVLLADPDRGVIAAVHAGRPGLAAGVVPAALDRMRDLGAREIVAVVGPSVCGRCYEVPDVMRAQVSSVAPAAHAVTWTGTPALDVAAGVVEQLADQGVAATWLPGCTREDADLYSYRRDHGTGRFAGIIVRRPPSDRDRDRDGESHGDTENRDANAP